MYTLKSIVRRGSAMGAAISLAVAAIVPAVVPFAATYADSLNPLTNRSLTLSSSAPGWSYTDGSGNAKYAPPNSGANGKQTGNTFQFNTTSDSTTTGIKAMTFQYCTQPAGQCRAPGDDSTHGIDTPTTSDLKVVAGTGASAPAELDNADFGTVVNPGTGIVSAVPGMSNPDNPSDTTGQYAAKNVAGSFVVYYFDGSNWVQSEGWHMKATNQEEATSGTTGQPNYITLVDDNASGEQTAANTLYKVVFFGTTDNYIQNPGSGAFFVKINTYSNFTDTDGGDTIAYNDDDTYTVSANDVIDGGVTVANVMNQSIQITTKVLETMQFSVGTVDPNVLVSDGTTGSAYYAATGNQNHSTCDTIATAATTADTKKNVLELGDQDSESALSTEHTYATHSYWRLSSNSSAGATVYYSGHTLSNTVGDQITPIGASKTTSHKGSEQFGLALATTALTGGNGFDDATYGVDYSQDRTGGGSPKYYENAADNDLVAIDDTTLLDNGATNSGSWDYTNLNGSYHSSRLDPLVPKTDYNGGSGQINSDGTGGPTQAEFAFDPQSDTVPVALATENSEVVDCVTAKMRYIANIAATTPAGIYTTKVNYIAAPQY